MPTENRSSNTEMVSLSRDLIDLTLAHLPNDSAAKWEIHEVLARPAPQPHPEPIAWMVGTAIWWTKEEAERDAAETGLPIVGLGPMAGVAEVERLNRALALAGHWCASALNAAQRADDAAESLGDIASLLRHQAKDIEAALSASAEPSAPVAPDPNRLCHIGYTAHPHRCGCLKGDEEAQRRYDEHCRAASAAPEAKS